MVPVVGEEGDPVRRLSIEDIREYTDNFDPKNFIGEFQFGRVYHGRIGGSKAVTVKIWDVPTKYAYFIGDNTNRLMDEVVFLQQPKISHPGLMKLYGYCREPEHCCIVYDFKSFNTLFNLIRTDDFKWWQRIKVALKFAHFLRFLHVQTRGENPLIIRNIDAAHIMVDEVIDNTFFFWSFLFFYNFAFLSMVTGCMFPDRTLYRVQHVRGSYGYVDPLLKWSPKTDVYGFGVVLLCLMTKQVYTDEERLNGEPCVADRSLMKYREGMANVKMSLVHKSFEADESFCAADGPSITRLAVRCVRYWFDDRPRMNEVVNSLQKLKVVRRHLNRYVEKEKPKFPNSKNPYDD